MRGMISLRDRVVRKVLRVLTVLKVRVLKVLKVRVLKVLRVLKSL